MYQYRNYNNTKFIILLNYYDIIYIFIQKGRDNLNKKVILNLTLDEIKIICEAVTILDDDIFTFGDAAVPAKISASTHSAVAKLVNFDCRTNDIQQDFPLTENELFAAKYALNYASDIMNDETEFIPPSLDDAAALKHISDKLTHYLLAR